MLVVVDVLEGLDNHDLEHVLDDLEEVSNLDVVDDYHADLVVGGKLRVEEPHGDLNVTDNQDLTVDIEKHKMFDIQHYEGGWRMVVKF